MTNPMDELDPFYLALIYFRINKVEEASNACTRILEKNPLDQVSLELGCHFEKLFTLNCAVYKFNSLLSKNNFNFRPRGV